MKSTAAPASGLGARCYWHRHALCGHHSTPIQSIRHAAGQTSPVSRSATWCTRPHTVHSRCNAHFTPDALPLAHYTATGSARAETTPLHEQRQHQCTGRDSANAWAETAPMHGQRPHQCTGRDNASARAETTPMHRQRRMSTNRAQRRHGLCELLVLCPHRRTLPSRSIQLPRECVCAMHRHHGIGVHQMNASDLHTHNTARLCARCCICMHKTDCGAIRFTLALSSRLLRMEAEGGGEG